MRALASLLVLLLVALTSCSEGQFPAKELRASFAVVQTSGKIKCLAGFSLASIPDTSVPLPPGDKVSCYRGSEKPVAMTRDSSSYEATLDEQAVAGAYYRFRVQRASGDTLTTSIRLPEPVILTSPADEAVIKKGTPLTVTWTPTSAADSDTVTEVGGFGASFTDQSGTAIFPGTKTAVAGWTGDYPASVSVTRRRQAKVHRGFAGGTIEALQFDTVYFSLVD
jgi:hypothetical protein